MTANGLAKLLEEMKEASSAMTGYAGSSHHDAVAMQWRLEDAIADVIAASTVTVKQLLLDTDYIMSRAEHQIKVFGQESFHG